MSAILARLLAEHQRTPHHSDMCDLCRDAAAELDPADRISALIVAADAVIACVVGDLPTEGWLQDCGMSRNALSALRGALQAVKTGGAA